MELLLDGSSSHAEAKLIRGLRAISPQTAAARAKQLRGAGWTINDIALAAGVTRVTISKWLKMDTEDEPSPSHPVDDRRDYDAELRKLGYRWSTVHQRVPLELVEPLRALWRVAYTHRKSKSVSTDSRAAGDALDVLISILLRRGVTNFTIAETAGVTHRAVLDRMARASTKCRTLCGEEFYGASTVVGWLGAAGDTYDVGAWLNPGNDWTPGAVKSSRRTGAARLRIRALTDQDERPYIMGASYVVDDLVRRGREFSADRPYVDEQRMAYLYAKAGSSVTTTECFISSQLLYVEPLATSLWTGAVTQQIPRTLWDKFFDPSPAVLEAMYNPSDVLDRYHEIKKPGPRIKRVA
jgi:hypothetical protein